MKIRRTDSKIYIARFQIRVLVRFGSVWFWLVTVLLLSALGIFCCVLFIRNWEFDGRSPSVFVKQIICDSCINFVWDNYIFPKTRGNKNKQWTHSTPVKPSSLYVRSWWQWNSFANTCWYYLSNSCIRIKPTTGLIYPGWYSLRPRVYIYSSPCPLQCIYNKTLFFFWKKPTIMMKNDTLYPI